MDYIRITDLTDNDLQGWDSTELDALLRLWDDRRESLERQGLVEPFLRRLQQEWAIETGLIERLYAWDRGVTEVLLDQGVDASLIAHRAGITHRESTRAALLIEDQRAVVEDLFTFVKNGEVISAHFIRGLHQQFTRHQDTTEALDGTGRLVEVPLLKGAWKRAPNNPRRPDGTAHTYAPPFLVDDEIRQLLEWHGEHDSRRVHPVLEAAWLHHRFAQIHPFQDGNGRVSRTLASIVLIRAGLLPLVVRNDQRRGYIDALEEADSGNLLPLVQLFARIQRDGLLRLISAEQQSQRPTVLDDILADAAIRLEPEAAALREAAAEVERRVDAVFVEAAKRMHGLKARIDHAFEKRGVRPVVKVREIPRTDDRAGRYSFYQIVEAAKQLRYFANARAWSAVVEMKIETSGETFDVVLSLHGYGPRAGDLFAVSMLTSEREWNEEREKFDAVRITAACAEPFVFSPGEPEASILSRFDDWMRSAEPAALDAWRKTLG